MKQNPRKHKNITERWTKRRGEEINEEKSRRGRVGMTKKNENIHFLQEFTVTNKRIQHPIPFSVEDSERMNFRLYSKRSTAENTSCDTFRENIT